MKPNAIQTFDSFKPTPHPLKALLKEHGMTQATAANFCGVSLGHFRDVLQGHATPSASLAAKLAEAVSLLGPDGDG